MISEELASDLAKLGADTFNGLPNETERIRSKVWLKNSDGIDVVVDPQFVSHVTPSGLPGCSVIHSKITGFLVIVLGDVRDVAKELWPSLDSCDTVA